MPINGYRCSSPPHAAQKQSIISKFLKQFSACWNKIKTLYLETYCNNNDLYSYNYQERCCNDVNFINDCQKRYCSNINSCFDNYHLSSDDNIFRNKSVVTSTWFVHKTAHSKHKASPCVHLFTDLSLPGVIVCMAAELPQWSMSV